MNDDWRLHGQEHWLMGKSLSFSFFTKQSDRLDHEHCEFCWAKFSERDGDLHEGYCTEPDDAGRLFWVCPTCFRDFQTDFKWKLPEDKKT